MPSTALNEDSAPPRAAIAAAAFTLGLRGRGIRDTAVLGAMERVPRELFAPSRFRDLARADVALPLACGQTMTGPTAVAAMLIALGAGPDQRALEIGTGSGYVTALLLKLGCRVRTVERYAVLAAEAEARFRAGAVEGAPEVEVGDGLGPELERLLAGARFDRILVNGAVSAVPGSLTSLLAPGGRLVGAVAADGFPRLVRIERSPEGRLDQETGAPLRLSAMAETRTAPGA